MDNDKDFANMLFVKAPDGIVELDEADVLSVRQQVEDMVTKPRLRMRLFHNTTQKGSPYFGVKFYPYEKETIPK